MAVTTVRVRGLNELLETLKRLPPEIVSKNGGPVRTAARKAMQVMQREAIENVQLIVDQPNKDGSTPDSSGTLEGAIIVSRMKPKPGFTGEIYMLRVKRSAKAPNGQTANKYGGVLEWGYEGVPAKAWMRRAFESTKEQVAATFGSELRKRIDAAVKKVAKMPRP